MPLRDWSDIQRDERPALAEIHSPVCAEVFVDRHVEPGVGRDQKQSVEMESTVAEDQWRGVPVPLVDWQVGSTDQDGKLVGRSGPWLAVRPGHEGRIDPVNLVLHRMDDRAARTGKLGEQEGQEMGGPTVIHPVSDHSGEAIHELSVGGMNSADTIVLVDSRFVIWLMDVG